MSKNINHTDDNITKGNSQGNNENSPKAPEFGGPKGPEPTRYGDWEKNGRVSDF